MSAERERLRTEERGILGRIDVLAADARLLDATLEKLALEEAVLTRNQAELERRRVVLAQNVETGRQRLRATALLLYRAGPLGSLRFVLEGADRAQLAGGWRLAHEITSRQRNEVVAVRTAAAELARVIDEGAAQQREHERLEAEATAARTQLAASIGERRTLLAQVRQQEAQRTQAIEELERASRELGEVLAGGTKAPRVTLDVHRFRGLLEPPADGPVLRGFGDRRDPRFGTVVPHRGWDIGAPHGAEVRAIFDGRVVWASWFRGYGLMVVVDHGHGVHSVYAHLSVITAQNGAEVQKGQSLGRVGDTGSLTGPLLYLEIREGGKAEDPAGWLRHSR